MYTIITCKPFFGRMSVPSVTQLMYALLVGFHLRYMESHCIFFSTKKNSNIFILSWISYLSIQECKYSYDWENINSLQHIHIFQNNLTYPIFYRMTKSTAIYGKFLSESESESVMWWKIWQSRKWHKSCWTTLNIRSSSYS